MVCIDAIDAHNLRWDGSGGVLHLEAYLCSRAKGFLVVSHVPWDSVTGQFSYMSDSARSSFWSRDKALGFYASEVRSQYAQEQRQECCILFFISQALTSNHTSSS